MVVSLEYTIATYFKLSRPQFVKNNPTIHIIFGAAGVSLASRMWVEGLDLIPNVFYIALVGEPRAGKSAFLRSYLRLFHSTNIGDIPIGSPEAMLKAIAQVRHGYVWYDEVSHLAKLLDSYMGTLPSILNRAYYLDELSQVRMNKEKSVVVPAESYFIHVYFAGTPADWTQIERKAPGGFIRRTLVIPVRGIIPFFSGKRPSHEERLEIQKLRRWISHIFKLLEMTRITVIFPEFNELGELLEKEQMENEKKSMIEEYFYKIMAGRLVGNLITFNLDNEPDSLILNDVLDIMYKNGQAAGIKVDYGDPSRPPVDVIIDATTLSVEVPENSKELNLDYFLPPHFAYLTYRTLLDTVKVEQVAPDGVTTANVERIKRWLESGGKPVVPLRTFVRQILHLGNPRQYENILRILEDAGYIRQIQWKYRGRTVRYIILDTSARICGNCAKFGISGECPKLRVISLSDKIYELVRPWDKACEEFEAVEVGDVDE